MIGGHCSRSKKTWYCGVVVLKKYKPEGRTINFIWENSVVPRWGKFHCFTDNFHSTPSHLFFTEMRSCNSTFPMVEKYLWITGMMPNPIQCIRVLLGCMHAVLSYFTGLVLYLILQFFWFSSSEGWGKMNAYNVWCKNLIIVGPKSHSLELQPKDLKWLTKRILANGCK